MNPIDFQKMLGLLENKNTEQKTFDLPSDSTSNLKSTLGFPTTFDHRIANSVTSVKD